MFRRATGEQCSLATAAALVGTQETVSIEPRVTREPSGIIEWLTSTDHKLIGRSYLITSFLFFCISGCMAIVIRTQLASPDGTIVSQHGYNELFTMHGSIMMYLFAGPFAFGGIANYLIPLQVGAPDMAFPRLNALSYWLYLTGGLTIVGGFLTVGGAADFGWVAYAPLSNSVNSPGAGPDMWIAGLILTGFSAIFTAVNILSTVFYLRAPGLTMFRLPIFTWDMIVTAILILIAFPVLTSALIMLWCDRHIGAHIFTVAGGGVPLLWQNLFWFFGHPEVYILVLPFFGIVTEVIAVFSRKPVFGYTGMVYATIAIGALSTAVWAHHMFTTGAVLLPFFSLMSYLIAVPTGIKYFNWIGTMWRGSVSYPTPMLFAVGFLIVFLFGGVTGVILASPPLDFALHDTYFVVAHFHQVLAGSAEFAGFAGIYYWYPKITGRMLREGLGKASFWFLLVGFFVTFMPQYLVGLHGMPRRVAEYATSTGWTGLNQVSTAGAYLLFVAVAFTLVNFYVSWRRPEPAGANPWDGQTLEWATSSPPPHHNFFAIPTIRSERPVWDFNHPEAAGHRKAHEFSVRNAVGKRLEERSQSETNPAIDTTRDEGESPGAADEHGPAITGLLKGEHASFRHCLEATFAEGDARQRRQLFEQLIASLSRHDVAEQVVLYPVVIESENGSSLRDEALRQERALAGALARVQRRLTWHPGGRRTRRKIEDFGSQLARHLDFEERVVFPFVDGLASEKKQRVMGAWVEQVERVAPTRPHPHGPQGPAGLATVGAGLALGDRVRDIGRRLLRPRDK